MRLLLRFSAFAILHVSFTGVILALFFLEIDLRLAIVLGGLCAYHVIQAADIGILEGQVKVLAKQLDQKVNQPCHATDPAPNTPPNRPR